MMRDHLIVLASTQLKTTAGVRRVLGLCVAVFGYSLLRASLQPDAFPQSSICLDWMEVSASPS